MSYGSASSTWDIVLIDIAFVTIFFNLLHNDDIFCDIV